jgi:molybdopterin synthase sulfur carrier subunit
MSIKIRYFASLKDISGVSEQDVGFTEGMTVKELWARVHNGKPLPLNILVAINMDYAGLDSIINDNDEVAFFPPVTGGSQ